MSARAMQAWAFLLNSRIDPATIGRSSRVMYYFQADCGRHLVHHSVRYVHEHPFKALNCRRCNPPQPLSSHEAEAWKIMQANLSSYFIWLPEAPVTGYSMRPADIWLPCSHDLTIQVDLVVQIDGEQHFTKPMHGISIAQQQARDDHFNFACENERLRVLRLHHADKHEWLQLLLQAISNAVLYPAFKFRCYSTSYACPDKWSVR